MSRHWGMFASAALVCIGAAAQAPERVPAPAPAADPETLFLDLSKVNLGPIANEEDKKRYLYTIQLEKARITHKTLESVYENAHDLYRSGDFEGVKELTGKILAIDPTFEDAAILQRASLDLTGTRTPLLSEQKLVENKFEVGMALYRQGRIVEAADRLEEAVKLAPSNLKARYWLQKVRYDLADEHFRRGQLAYRQHRLRETLDQWYAALVMNPRYPRLVGAIAKVEAELRQADANNKLQTALQLYSDGKPDESLRALDQVLQVEPGDPRAQHLVAEIRAEIAQQHVTEGRRLYGLRQYDAAIAQWNRAVEYGYDSRAANLLIARTEEQMHHEVEAKERLAAEAKARAEEEARRQAEAEAQKKAEAEAQQKAEDEAKKALQAGASAGAAARSPASLPAATTAENREAAKKRWEGGIIAYDKGDYDTAKNQWEECKQLDPSNADCTAGLKRIDQQFGGQ